MVTYERVQVDDVAFGGPEASVLREPNIPTKVSTEEVRYGFGTQRLGVGVADARPTVNGRPAGPTFFVPLSHEAALDRGTEEQSLAVLAETMGARVVGIDNPGVGRLTSRMRFTQGLALLRGSFKPHAVSMTRAAVQAAELQPGEAVSVLGYSRGASIATEMMGQLSELGHAVERLVLVEPAANQRHGRHLLGRILAEAPATDRAVAVKRRFGWVKDAMDRRVKNGDPTVTPDQAAFEKSRWRQRPATLLGGLAMMLGRLNPRLERIIRNGKNLQQTIVDIINFDGSYISNEKRNVETAAVIERVRAGRRAQLGQQAIVRAVTLTEPWERRIGHGAWQLLTLQDYIGGIVLDPGRVMGQGARIVPVKTDSPSLAELRARYAGAC